MLGACYGYGFFRDFSRECPSHGAMVPSSERILPISVEDTLFRGGMRGHQSGPRLFVDVLRQEG